MSMRLRLHAGMAALMIAAAVAAPASAGDIALRVAATRPAADQVLLGAYDALMAGDLAVAEAGYAAVLARDAHHAAALHGLAAIAVRRTDHARAEAYYRRALDADPADAIAFAGLQGLGRNIDAVLAESRLKTLIAGQPEQPVLRFTLGNVYAAQGRWHDAQQQYFLAHAGDPGQPDYLFNLAVSFDQLHQLQLAREHYRLALTAATRRPAAFDPAQAAASLRTLP